MVELGLIIVMLCLLTATGSALIALRLQYRSLDNSRQEREGWQQAQEGRQRTWEVRQGKHILDAEKKLADQLKDARHEWRDWGAQVRQDHQEWRDSVDLEKELARLPHIEQIELTHQAHNGHLQPKDWRPPMFYKTDLHGRDLSHRYMERADLREAQLMEANLYMADLTGASLAGASLQQANLIGANLSGADLRGANLSGVNLLVADLHNAVLHGTNLIGASNLTPAQLQTAIYDSTTLIDSAIDITLPRIPGVLTTPAKLLTAMPTSSQQVDETTDAPLAREENVSSASSDRSEENTTPTSIAELTENTTPTSIAELTENNTSVESENAVLLPSVVVLVTATETITPAPFAEGSTDAPALSIDNKESIPESAVSANEASKKSSTTRKRPSKTKAAAAIPIQTLTSRQEETSAEKLDESHLPALGEEDEEIDEEELFPNKIIQWQARAPKTKPLESSDDQNKGDQAQKKRGNSRTANLNSTTNDTENQHAHAN